ncbi:nicotinamide mononucleotide transporter [Candidatus Pacearchaeota archaeon]|nr:nicotinamide mononucleotide transporter [Candidatus Pacearchaeota archaeon]
MRICDVLSRQDRILWSLTLLSIVGVVFNVLQRRESFGIWMFTNMSWCIVNWKKGIPSQSFLFFVYFILSVWGWIAWA